MDIYNIRETRWQVSPELLSSRIDDDIIIMSIRSGFYYTLDQVGSCIWDILSTQSSTIEELADQLKEEYEIDNETCIKDVQEFIEDIASKKLIIPVGK